MTEIASFDKLPHFVLASASPRRRELLAMVGLHFEVVTPGIEETIIGGEPPRQHAARLAQAKAHEVSSKRPDRWVLGADTIVVIGGQILGKPGDEDEAIRMLHGLSGRDHTVMTGFCICKNGAEQEAKDVIESVVSVKDLSEREIRGYIKTGEPFDKAGAYAVQGIGMFMIERISGSYANVVGLPVCEVVDALERLGAIELFK
ncbi:MAG: septum formation inhibitor Maf [Deltaproteobacteria bacterium]|nr:septum formation inhibitor Maf [Deltaproteobacteria bacterium]